jgi:hypothetical protein
MADVADFDWMVAQAGFIAGESREEQDALRLRRWRKVLSDELPPQIIDAITIGGTHDDPDTWLGGITGTFTWQEQAFAFHGSGSIHYDLNGHAKEYPWLSADGLAIETDGPGALAGFFIQLMAEAIRRNDTSKLREPPQLEVVRARVVDITEPSPPEAA